MYLLYTKILIYPTPVVINMVTLNITSNGKKKSRKIEINGEI